MFSLLVLLACGGADATPAPTPAPTAAAPAAAPVATASVRDVDVGTLHADREAGRVPVLVDVRTPEEYAAGHVPGAINVPLDAIGGRLGELAPHKDGEVYVICQSGRRSTAASATLAAHGFRPVNVAGGTAAWRAAGYTVE